MAARGAFLSLLTQDVNYGDLIVEALHRYPQRQAFVFGSRSVTYAQAASRTGREPPEWR